jgi:hypothetical protein
MSVLFFWRIVQEVVEGRIQPLDIGLAGQLLEPMQVFLGDLVAGLLVLGIAKINPASKRPGFAGGAQVLFLERAKVSGHRPVVARSGGQKHLRFQVAEVKDVAELLEPAAPAAGHA